MGIAPMSSSKSRSAMWLETWRKTRTILPSLYISTNAPISPYLWVDEKWADVYRDVVKWKHGAEFYGMISNLDYNLGLLREKLKDLNLSNDTILIFMTDNGTAKGGAGKAEHRRFSWIHGWCGNYMRQGLKSPPSLRAGTGYPFLFTTQQADFPVDMTAGMKSVIGRPYRYPPHPCLKSVEGINRRYFF